MNIQDIAKIANVSVSTVSKVINNKDSDISEKTRKKVMDVVKEYQFIPYSGIKSKLDLSTRSIGLVFPSLHHGFFPRLLGAIEKAIFKAGYSLIVYCSERNLENEKKCLDILQQKKVEGILFYPSYAESVGLIKQLDVKVVVFGKSEGRFPKYRFDYKQAAYIGVKHLIVHNHKKIGCILGENREELFQGYLNAITEAGIRFDQMLVIQASNTDNKDYINLIHADITGIICSDIHIASQIYRLANERNLKIPGDLSVVACDNTDISDMFVPPVDAVVFPVEQMGTEAAESIIKIIETRRNQDKEIIIAPELLTGSSVCPPKHLRGKNIVVVGSMNMDTFFNADHIPQIGETIMSGNKTMLPGGKGANQAVGASRLNGNVYMIGRLGNDQNGRDMYSNLINNNVNTDGVVFDDSCPTGTAYVAVDMKGNNSIIVHGGANDNLDKAQIDSAGDILDNAEYALVQMEIPIELVKYVIGTCNRKNVNVILKPAPAKNLPDEYYKGLFLIIPNETEANQLCPDTQDIESQAEIFIKKGARHVIITLAEKGCFYTNGTESHYFEAAKFEAVDSTGASDSFISALAVRLAEGSDMHSSIEYAMCAAGISVTKVGAQPALPERHMVELYMRSH